MRHLLLSFLLLIVLGCLVSGWLVVSAQQPVATLPTSPASSSLLVSSPHLKLRAQEILTPSASIVPTLANPLSLAAVDWNEDGLLDLIVGTATSTGGTLHFLSGTGETNSVATAPFRSFQSLAIALPPAFLTTGDFDADGHADVALSAPGERTVSWFRGNGRGEFSQMPALPLPGAVTTMLGGEINRSDGLADVIVAVDATAGARLLVFEGPQGALQSTPEVISLPAPATALALGRFRADLYADLAIACGQQLRLLVGRDRRLSHDASRQAEAAPLQIKDYLLPTPILALAAGDFAGHQQTDLALLGADGNLQLLSLSALHQEFSTTPLTTTSALRTIAHVTEAAALRSSSLLAARLASRPGDQLLLFAPLSSQLQVFSAAASATAEEATPLSLTVAKGLRAVLPLRLNRDALADLVVLTATSLTAMTTEAQAIYTVTNQNASGTGSLDQALKDANANPGLDQIHFNLSGTGPFSLATATEVTDAVVLDGTTQPGYVGKPLIRIGPNGNRLPNGLIVSGGNCTIRGLLFNGVRGDQTVTQGGGYGLWLKTQGNNIIEANWIGLDNQGACTLDSRGNCPTGNTYGLRIENSSNNLIGGTTSSARNVISSNVAVGVIVTSGSGNQIKGNYVGPDFTGLKRIGSYQGIQIESNQNQIGGTEAGAGNLISCANGIGVGLFRAQGCLIQGNFFGTDPNGEATRGQNLFGNNNELNITESSSNTIGGTAAAARNLFADQQGCVSLGVGSNDNVVQGNYIGVSKNGAAAVGYAGGIAVSGSRNLIGGNTVGARNLIWGGASIGGDTNQLQGNFLGTNATGTAPLQNLIDIFRPSNYIGVGLGGRNNLVGGTTPEVRNLISGNVNYGVVIGGENNQLLGNYIGTQIDGNSPLGNGNHGVFVVKGKDQIGGTQAGASNVIAHNAEAGVNYYFSATNTHIRGNAIFSNQGLGIDYDGHGVDANIPNENHSGFDAHQNSPVITIATTSKGGLLVQGTLNSYANTTFAIDVFANATCDGTGYGEGKVYLGSTTVSTGADHNGVFSLQLPSYLRPEQIVTATATKADGITSEFSPCQSIVAECFQVYHRPAEAFPATGGAGQLDFGAVSDCAWTITSNANWLTLTSPTTGQGNAAVRFQVAANTTPFYRTATLSLAGKPITIGQAGRAGIVSGASYQGENIARDSIVSAFAGGMATTSLAATSLPLPTSLGGTKVVLKNTSGSEYLAPLFYISPNQVNFLMPAGIVIGTHTVTITSGDGAVFTSPIQVVDTYASLFSANADGSGVLAGNAVRVKSDGTLRSEPVAQYDAGLKKFVPRTIDFGNDDIFLELYGTGIRNNFFLFTVSAKIGGETAQVTYAGKQTDFVGLDQVNLKVPRSLIGRGEVPIVLTVNGVTTNTVLVHFK